MARSTCALLRAVSALSSARLTCSLVAYQGCCIESSALLSGLAPRRDRIYTTPPTIVDETGLTAPKTDSEDTATSPACDEAGSTAPETDSSDTATAPICISPLGNRSSAGNRVSEGYRVYHCGGHAGLARDIGRGHPHGADNAYQLVTITIPMAPSPPAPESLPFSEAPPPPPPPP